MPFVLNYCRKKYFQQLDITNYLFLLWDLHILTLLRNVCHARLTLFNTKRSGEPAWLGLEEWKDVEDNVWLDKNKVEQLDPLENALVSELKTTY